MKKLRALFILVFTLAMMFSTSVFVGADTTTDLESMKVYAVDAEGNQTEVPMEFNSTTYEYDLTVLSTTDSIAIEAATADSTSTWVIEKDGINTKMDEGVNYTAVKVTSATGATQVYVLNTTKLTAEEEATYEAPEVTGEDGTEKSDTDKTVTVGKQEMQIASSFDESAIPEGFEEATAEYDGEEYACIKGEVKNLTAFYLYNDDTEGFYIYNADSNEFYVMNNIQIKSRMYTIVNPETTESMLKNYDKKKVTIIDQEVKAWVLDEEEGMYLVYAMNWNGDTELYCYDDNEKCFQRYLLSSDETAQVEAAKTAYENIQNKHNNLVDRYNILLKVVCGLVIVIIILIFIIINLLISKKEKKINKEKRAKRRNDLDDSEDNDSVETAMVSEEVQDMESEDDADEIVINDVTEDMSEEVSEEIVISDEEIEEVVEEIEEIEEIEDNQEDIKLKHGLFGTKDASVRTYGDEPTFGTDKEETEGYYGGELDDEDIVLIEIDNDEEVKPVQPLTQEEVDMNTAAAQQETEEDIKAVLQSMLSDSDDEEDDDDDDDDIEFITLDE